MPDELPKATERPGDRRVHRGADRDASTPTRPTATSTSASRASRTTGSSPGQRPDQVEEQEPNEKKEDPARLRALEGEQGRARTPPGTRRGAAAGRAGTSSARRWPRTCSGRVVRDPRRRPRPLFPHHENELAQSRALGHDFARIWAHNGLAPVHRREDVEVGRQRRHDPRGARHVGPRGAAPLLPRPATGASRSTSPTRRWRRRRRGPRRSATRSRSRRRSRSSRLLGRLRRRARGRLRHAARARRHARVGLERPARPARARRSRSSGSSRWPSRSRRRRWSRSPSSARRRAREAATSRRPIGCATRSRRPGGRCATAPAGYVLVPKKP